MKTLKIKTNFAKVKDNELGGVAQNIVTSLTNNPLYPSPSPSLQDVKSAVNAYSQALQKCLNGTKDDIVLKNKLRAALEKQLYLLGAYINISADSDEHKLGTSGFQLAKTPASIGILPAPELLKISDGNNPGQVYFNISPARKAKGYNVIYAQVPAPVMTDKWQSRISSYSKGYISGLESGKKYIFKATALSSKANLNNSYNYTNPVERFIQ